MKKLLVSLAGILAAIPGLATILTGLGAPPGRKWLFGGLVEAFGTLALLLVVLNRTKIQRLTPKHVTRVTVALGSTFAICLAAYLILINQCIIADCAKSEKVFFPIWLRGALKEEVQAHGGSRYETLCKLQDWVRREIDGARVDTNISAVILLFLYACTSTSMVLAFAYPGFYFKHPGQVLRDSESSQEEKKAKRGKK
jgi:hypothetical protein